MKQRSVSGDSSCQPTDVLAHEDLRRASNAGAPKIAREDEPDRFSILMFPGDRIFSFRIPATHSKHSEKRPTYQPWSVVLLAV